MLCKRIFRFLPILLLLAACQVPFQDSSVVNGLETDDLTILPGDKGGTNTPYLLGDTTAPYGFYIYLPDGYDSVNYDYPLLLFLHGSGEKGNSTPASPSERDAALTILKQVQRNGPPKLIKNGTWRPSYPMIVVSPQSTGWWNAANIQDFLTWLESNYRINTSRIYLTGLSMGGYGTFNYLTTYGNTGKAAAAVPICGSGNVSRADQCREIPIWAFHGEADSTVNMSGSVNFVNAYNSLDPPPSVSARLTLYPGVGHDSWSRTYDGSGMGDENPVYTPFTISIYDWLFTYKKP